MNDVIIGNIEAHENILISDIETMMRIDKEPDANVVGFIGTDIIWLHIYK